MTQTTLQSGMNTAFLPWLSCTPNRILLVTNGVDFARRWRGRTAALETAGIAAPEKGPTISASAATTYTTGTIAVNIGATRVVGSGTTFTSNMIGGTLQVTGHMLVYYEIADVINATTLTLASPYARPDDAAATFTITYPVETYYAAYRFTDDATDFPDYIGGLQILGPQPGNLCPLSSLDSSVALTAFSWSKLSPYADARQVYVQIFRSTGGEATTLYLIATLGSHGTITSSASNGAGSPKVVLTVPSGHNLKAGASITIAGHSVSGYNATTTLTAVTATTLTTSIAYTSIGTGGTWVLEGLVSDASSDDAISIGVGTSNSITTSQTDGAGHASFVVPSGSPLVVGSRIAITGHSVAAYNTTATVTVAGTAGFTTDLTYTSAGTGGIWSALAQDLPISTPDGALNAYRFGVPPNFKAVSVPYQDRQWYGVNVNYTTGTVAVTAGSVTVMGTATAWTSAMAGRYFTKVGDTRSYKILTASSTTLTLTEAYAGSTTSGDSYGIYPPDTERNTWWYSEAGEVESVPTVNTIRIQNNTGVDDDDVGAGQLNSSLYLLQKKHIYRLNYNRQPNIDASILPAVARGAFNARCWDTYQGMAYLMDRAGAYVFDGQQQQPIGAAIQNYWREASIDFTKSANFFVKISPAEDAVRFFIVLAGNSNTRPQHAFCWSITNQAWWVESYAHEVGSACEAEISGRQRVLLGSQLEQVLLSGEGLSDWISTAVVGTCATSTTTTTLKGTGFTAAMVGCPVAITAGTAKGCESLITGYTNSTTLTMSPALTTAPAVGDTYLIGGVPYSAKTGMLQCLPISEENSRSIRTWWTPTTNAAAFDIRRYIDQRTSPENFPYDSVDESGRVAVSASSPDGVVNMLATQFTSQVIEGFARLPAVGGSNDTGLTDRFLAVELRGYQSLDAIQISNLAVDGVL